MKNNTFILLAVLGLIFGCKKSTVDPNGNGTTTKQDIIVVPVNYTINAVHDIGTSYYSVNYELNIMHDSGSFFLILYKDTLVGNVTANFSLNNNAINTEYSCSAGNLLWDHVTIGDKIDASASWQTYGYGYSLIPGQTDGFITPGSGNKYIGFRYLDHQLSYSPYTKYYKYGWILVSYSADAKSLTVKEYAYNNKLNTGLKPGEK